MTKLLFALVFGQIGLHAAMSGARMAAPLLVLRQAGEGVFSGAQAAGIVLGFFALAPALTSMAAGRWVDRRGYHKPVRLAAALTMLGSLLACSAVYLGGWLQTALLLVAAMAAGAGANLGFIAILRTAGRLAESRSGGTSDSAVLKKMFAWMGVAPSIANALGPLMAGALIDWVGYGWAFGVLALTPLITMALARVVPPEPGATVAPQGSTTSLRDGIASLLAVPGMGRVLTINWFFSAAWDLHALMVPVLGHELNLSASAIGTVLGAFAIAVSATRLAVPAMARHLSEVQVFTATFIAVAAVFAGYPLAHSAFAMVVFASLLGMALGVVQPLIMTTLHRLAPPARQGETIALRLALIHLSNSTLPLLFGALGASLGAAMVFRVMSLIVLSGVGLPRSLERIQRLRGHEEPHGPRHSDRGGC